MTTYMTRTQLNALDTDGLTNALEAAAFGNGPRSYNGYDFAENELQYTRDTVSQSRIPNRLDKSDSCDLSNQDLRRAAAGQTASNIKDQVASDEDMW